jgi:hypothetical protein
LVVPALIQCAINCILSRARMAPRNPEQEKEILDWIEAVMEEPLPEGDFAEVLKNGVMLCKLMNKIVPGSVKKFKEKVCKRNNSEVV